MPIGFEEVFDVMELKKVNLCGVSMGAWIGQDFLLKYPDRVKGAVLIAPPSLMKMRVRFVLR